MRFTEGWFGFSFMFAFRLEIRALNIYMSLFRSSFVLSRSNLAAARDRVSDYLTKRNETRAKALAMQQHCHSTRSKQRETRQKIELGSGNELIAEESVESELVAMTVPSKPVVSVPFTGFHVFQVGCGLTAKQAQPAFVALTMEERMEYRERARTEGPKPPSFPTKKSQIMEAVYAYFCRQQMRLGPQTHAELTRQFSAMKLGEKKDIAERAEKEHLQYIDFVGKHFIEAEIEAEGLPMYFEMSHIQRWDAIDGILRRKFETLNLMS